MVVVSDELRDRTEAPSVEELERLWLAPAREPEPPARHPRAAVAGTWLGRLSPLAWLGSLVVLMGFGPDADTPVVPLWADVVATALFLALAGAAVLAMMRLRSAALTASLAAAAAGILLGWGCRATAHHTGSWWMVELGLFAGLFAVSAAALALGRRGTR